MDGKNHKTYQFIIDYVKEHGYAPTYREIAENINCAISAVPEILYTLEIVGLIKVKRKSSRAIQLVGYRFVKKGN